MFDIFLVLSSGYAGNRHLVDYTEWVRLDVSFAELAGSVDRVYGSDITRCRGQRYELTNTQWKSPLVKYGGDCFRPER